jgi:pyruvate/2-oxoglutarate dehydrogenase complex dihydrolipoamide acyltransferase (E2) component
MFGYRVDGKKVRDIDPIQRIVPHIMRHRHDSMNLIAVDLPCEPFDEFIKKESAAGNGEYDYMHIIIAGLVRIIANYPRLNRFVMNGRIYKRNVINISFVVRKGMSPDAPDTTVKLEFTGHETIAEVKDKINAVIEANSHMEADNGTDKIARLITFTPNVVIAMLIGLIKFLDKHSLLPKAIIDVSPFHTTAFITNMKSIKGPSIYHHVYDFGNTGMFFSMGKEAMVPVVSGKEVVPGKRLPFKIVTDERFCDGFYFASALRVLRKYYTHPEVLKEPLEELAEDVTVIDRHSFKKSNRGDTPQE